MRSVFVPVMVVLLSAAAARADEGIPPKTLAAIKAATVYIKVEAKGLSGSASGFVIKTDHDIAYIVTNHHVIEPKVLELILVPRGAFLPRAYPYNLRRPGVPMPYRRVPSLPRRTLPILPSYTPRLLVRSFKDVAVTIVFHSGLPDEESVKGEVVTADPDQDLAVIKVSGVKALPKPIDIVHQPQLTETMPIYTFGFPFGKVLATSKGGPAITIGKGSISSLRIDDDGNLTMVQIDSALNPGNSGGPVVDAQGRLVGVARATIRDSSGIGLAIPCRELTRTLAGRAGKVYVHVVHDGEGAPTAHVEVGLIDPLNKIKSVEFDYIVGGSHKDKPKPTDPLAPLAGCRKLPLKIENQVATGEFTLEKGATEVAILGQASYVNESGKPEVTKSAMETYHVSHPSAVAGGESGSNPQQPHGAPRPGQGWGRRHLVTTQIVGGAGDPQFRDEAPRQAMLVGFEVGLGKRQGRDTICAIRPIYLDAEGEQRLGGQHGRDISRVVRVAAKPGYAVGGVEAKAGQGLNGLSVTFMLVRGDRLDPKDTYKSDWIGGTDNAAPVRLGGGEPIAGIIGRENSRDCTGLGLLESAPESGNVAAVPPRGHLPRSQSGHSSHRHAHGGMASSEIVPITGGSAVHFIPEPPPPPLPVAALEKDRVTRDLPEPIDDVIAGAGGRCLLLHLPTLRKLAVFDVAKAKVAHYVSLSSGDVLYAAGRDKLLVIDREQNLIQRFDLETFRKELTVALPDADQVTALAMGYASAGRALMATRSGPKLLDVAKLAPADVEIGNRDENWWRSPCRIRASGDGGTFAVCGNMSGACRLLTLDSAGVHYRNSEGNFSGPVIPSYDGRLLFTGSGPVGEDMRPTSPQNRGACFPACDPAYYLAGGERRSPYVNRAERPNLSLYTTGDRRLLFALPDLDELSDPQGGYVDRQASLSMDKRVHFFPSAKLLVTVAASRQQLVLRRLDVAAALNKAGVDYLYVTSLPPVSICRGATLDYTVAVQSRRGGVHYTLDSGPDGMTLSADGKLHWSVPGDDRSDREGVIITITDAGGQEVLHSFNIALR